MPKCPDRLRCDRCDAAGTPADLATGWSLSRPARPTGATGRGPVPDRPPAMLCPGCARDLVRDLEARLDR